MKANEHVYPSEIEYEDGYSKRTKKYQGIDLRTYFAAMAMQGLLAYPAEATFEDLAINAVSFADALIAELNKEKK